MARVKRGVTAHFKHKKILKLAKGYRESNSKLYRIALEKVEKGLQYAYRDRRKKKATSALCGFSALTPVCANTD